MRAVFPALAAMLAAGLPAADSPAPATVSADTLAMLDPTRRAVMMCGSRQSGAVLQARLRLASAIGQDPASGPGASPVAIPVPAAIRLPVTGGDPEVARLVRQGLLLAYGFNHQAAILAFREAQRRDPGCAICFWGEAYALGPNINAPMEPQALPQAIAAIGRASRLAAAASPAERALIEALARRYSADAGADRAALEAAYADAMLAAAARFPDDDDVAVIAAEAAMNTRPWDYWEADRTTPKPRIGEAIRLVETVLARRGDHPQAQHLYIHLVEASGDPRRAEAAADRLAAASITSAGHLVHMPGHIYYVLGRFADSIRVNVEAARADEAYLAGAGENPTYRYGYYPHNVHFLLTSAQMAGDMDVVVEQSARLSRIVNPAVAAQLAWLQPVTAAPYTAYAQFGSPEQILALGEADARLPFVVAMRHYARAVARAQQRNRAEFDRELAALRAIRESDAIRPMLDQGAPARDLLRIAEHVALGRQAFAAGRYDEAAGHYGEAAAIEDNIPYLEPPWWYYPVRQSLGAALYRAGRLDEAKAAFTAALARSPNNGWVLYGLARTERALGHRLEAAATEAALRRAWLGDPRWLRIDRL